MYCVQEKLAFVDWINYRLGEDVILGPGSVLRLLPIPEAGNALFSALENGILMK